MTQNIQQHNPQSHENNPQTQTQGLELSLSSLNNFLVELLKMIPDSDRISRKLLERLKDLVQELEQLQKQTNDFKNTDIANINSRELASVLFNAAARIIASYEIANNNEISNNHLLKDKTEFRRLINKYKINSTSMQKGYSIIEVEHISHRLSEWEKAVSEAKNNKKYSLLARNIYLAKTPIRASVTISGKQEKFEGVQFMVRGNEDLEKITALILTSNVSVVSYDKNKNTLIIQDNDTKKFYRVEFPLFKSSQDLLDSMLKKLDEFSQNPGALSSVLPIPAGSEALFGLTFTQTALRKAEELARTLLGDSYDNSSYKSWINGIQENINRYTQQIQSSSNKIDQIPSDINLTTGDINKQETFQKINQDNPILNSRISALNPNQTSIEIVFNLGNNTGNNQNSLLNQPRLIIRYNKDTSLSLSNNIVNGFQITMEGLNYYQNLQSRFIEFLKLRYKEELNRNSSIQALIDLISRAWQQFANENLGQNLPQISSCQVSITDQKINQSITYPVSLSNQISLPNINLGLDHNKT
ncbi:MAG: hypothetical protein QXF76_03750 [Candidatus Anstonellales archaeon]